MTAAGTHLAIIVNFYPCIILSLQTPAKQTIDLAIGSHCAIDSFLREIESYILYREIYILYHKVYIIRLIINLLQMLNFVFSCKFTS